MTIDVEKVRPRGDPLPKAVTEVDRVWLSWEDRERAHLRARSGAGRDLRISLPRGSSLESGDVLAIDGNVAVVVAATDEELLELSPRDQLDWIVVGYNLGNLHRRGWYANGIVITPYDPAIERLIGSSGVPMRRLLRPVSGRPLGIPARHERAAHVHEQAAGRGFAD